MPLTIVVADDDRDYRKFLRYLLASVPDDVTVVGEAGDGEEALAVVARVRPDVLVTDVVMPRLDGVALARRVREALPAIRIILMSSYHDDANRLRASSGADAFVSKQAIGRSLLTVIGDLTGRHLSGGSGPRLGGADASSSPAAPPN
jgi:YesN/AraC family two-component response regulator